jgi:hypothetical protein
LKFVDCHDVFSGNIRAEEEVWIPHVACIIYSWPIKVITINLVARDQISSIRLTRSMPNAYINAPRYLSWNPIQKLIDMQVSSYIMGRALPER